jgi:hypothetical protein
MAGSGLELHWHKPWMLCLSDTLRCRCFCLRRFTPLSTNFMTTAHSPEALYQGIKYHLFFDMGYEHGSLARGPFVGLRAVVSPLRPA